MNKKLTYQAYYTKSEPILNYMTNILQINSHDSILEPCGGDGVFVDKILGNSPKSNISVFELNPDAVILLQDKYKGNNNVYIRKTDTLLDNDILSCNPQIRN